MKRAAALPSRSTYLAIGLLAAALGGLLLCMTRLLEGKWLVATLIGIFLPWLALATKDVERFLLGTFVFLIPINASAYLRYEPVTSGANGINLSVCDIALFGLYVLWAAKLLGQRPEQRRIHLFPTISIPFGLLMLWSGFSITQSITPIFSWYEWIRLLKTGFAFWYLANNIDREAHLLTIAGSLCLSVCGQGIVAVAQHFLGTTFGLKTLGETENSLLFHQMGSVQIMRVGGTLGHPNSLAFFLVTILPIVLVLLLAYERWWIRLLALFTFMVGCAGLILTFSRGAWLSFSLMTPVIVWLLAWKHRGWWHAVTRLAGFAFFITLVLVPFASSIAHRLFEYDYGRAWSRVPLMQVACNMIMAHPILGVGLNNYTLVMDRYDNTLEHITRYVAQPVHNLFLLVAAEVGLPGLAFFLWLLAVLLRRAWHGFWQRDGVFGAWCLALLGSLSSYLLHGLVDFKYLGSNYSFALLMGLAAALGARPSAAMGNDAQ